MSTDPTPDDAGPGPAEASGQDTQALIEQLRAAPAEEIVADLFSTLLSTAQVKLGRRDARLFIDLCAQASDYAGPYVPEDLVKQVETALGQLRLAQVSAEAEVAKKGEPEPNDLSRAPTPPHPGARTEAPAGDQQPPASKLWVPGR